MICVTVGTHHQGFERLLGALGPLAELDELVVQYGVGPRPAEADVAIPFLSALDLVGHMQRARAVVIHAGVGSFLVARRAGHIPVMVPRLRRFGEHVDDHQAQLARALARRGDAIAVWDVARLTDAVRAVPPRRPVQARTPAALPAAVRRALDGGAPAPWLPEAARGADAGVEERVRAAPYSPA